MTGTTAEMGTREPAPAAAAGTRMRAQAAIATEPGTTPDGRTRTRLTRLRSQAPLMLYSTRAKEPEPWASHGGDPARVSLAAGAAGPVGGDRLRLDVEVGPETALVLTDVSPSLLLPGRDGAPSRMDVRIHVAREGTLVWLPEPLVAARGCDHLSDVRVDLADDARLLLREQVLLGRHGEPPGRVRLSTRVRRAGRALFRQDLELGAGAGDTPAVAGAHRAVASVLVVDPDWRDAGPPGPERERQRTRLLPGDAVLTPLAAGAVLIGALCDDNLELRDRIADGLTALGPPWDLRPARTRHH